MMVVVLSTLWYLFCVKTLMYFHFVDISTLTFIFTLWC